LARRPLLEIRRSEGRSVPEAREAALAAKGGRVAAQQQAGQKPARAAWPPGEELVPAGASGGDHGAKTRDAQHARHPGGQGRLSGNVGEKAHRLFGRDPRRWPAGSGMLSSKPRRTSATKLAVGARPTKSSAWHDSKARIGKDSRADHQTGSESKRPGKAAHRTLGALNPCGSGVRLPGDGAGGRRNRSRGPSRSAPIRIRRKEFSAAAAGL